MARRRNKSNLVDDDGIKLTVHCKSGGLCVLNPTKLSDVNCKTCSMSTQEAEK